MNRRNFFQVVLGAILAAPVFAFTSSSRTPDEPEDPEYYRLVRPIVYYWPPGVQPRVTHVQVSVVSR